ncbi:MAG: hypothetical protein HBSAPP02_25530 [Phycisphaerae bacterium]|nr:MAG: hypothetical protein HBSAPP02_25530 [Phycisphaerae bacterium]
MKPSMRAARVVILAVAGWAYAASGALAIPPSTKTITIEGRAAGTSASAMEQAKQDALRRAVEQACGTFINSQSRAQNYTSVYDKVMASAAGYVTEFDVLSRRVEAGTSICEVRAVVSTESFESEWTRLAHTIEAEGNPRCIVVFIEDNDVDDDRPAKANGVSQSVIESFFLNKGVQLMDRGAGEEARGRDLTLAAMNDDVGKLAAMAASFKADVAVRGNAEARRAGTTQLGGRTLYKWTATINVRAYHADSAQMLMANSYTASHSTVNSNAGGDEALRKCAEEQAGAILRDVGESWRKRQQVRRICQITLENCTRKEFKLFEAALREVDGVQDVKLRELVNNVCQVEVDWSYDLERLVTRIEELKAGGLAFEASEQTHDRATFKIRK